MTNSLPAGLADRRHIAGATSLATSSFPALAPTKAASGRRAAMAEKVEFGDDYEFPKEVHNMLVQAQATHVEFSAMADSKASILMGATFVVFSLTIGEMESNRISLPLLLLGAFSFAATVLSVLAILPEIGGKMTGKPNLLFFGVFCRMKEEEFVDELVTTMRSEEQVYRMMARDLHQNGVVLQRHKYRWLKYAYRTFLVGIVVTALGFIGQSLFG
jgi:hypothetical protein